MFVMNTNTFFNLVLSVFDSFCVDDAVVTIVVIGVVVFACSYFCFLIAL